MLSDFALISVLLIAAHLLRAAVPALSRFLIPTSMIAGILALALGPGGYNLLPFARDAAGKADLLAYPGILITLLFATLLLGHRPTISLKTAWHASSSSFLYNLASEVMQYGVVICLGVTLLATLFVDLRPEFIVMLPSGFAGGHGTAALFADALPHWEAARSVGFTFATIGILFAVFGGLAIINTARRRGWVKTPTDPASAAAAQSTFLPREAQEPIGRATVNGMALDSLAWHVALVLGVYGMTMVCMPQLRDWLPANFVLPAFGVAMVLGWLTQAALNAGKLGEYVDQQIISRIGGLLADYLVAFGIASINVQIVLDYALPIMVFSLLGLVICMSWMLIVAPRVFGERWFDNAIFTYGWNTGTIAFGVALLRIVDTRKDSRVLADYGIAFIAIGPLEALLYTIVLTALATGQLLMLGIALIVSALALAALAIWRARRAFAVLLCLPLALAAYPNQLQAAEAPTKTIAEIVAAMTTEEKVNLVVGTGVTLRELVLPAEFQRPTTGDKPLRIQGAGAETYPIARLGIPAITLADGPAGLRIDPHREGTTQDFFASAFPIGSALAASWDTDLVRRVGSAMGSEARAYGVDVILAPALNIHRNPLGGRNFEYYSEDPLLSGRMAASMVKGIQSEGVGATLKHFVANDHEWNRFTIDVRLSERALREIYLRPFEIAVREAEPWAVMSSYNKVNGTYTSESPRLLTDILRNELGFSGMVMTDWFGGVDPLAQVNAGNDLLTPGTIFQQRTLLDAVAAGKLPPDILDRNVSRILELIRRTPSHRGITPTNHPDLAAHALIAREAAAAGMVLLQNNNALPLRSGARIALVGNAAYATVIGGTGSGDVNEAYAVSIAEGLSEAGFSVDRSLAAHYDALIKSTRARRGTPQSLLPKPMSAETPIAMDRIERSALENDAAILVIGRNSGEFADRSKAAGDFALNESEVMQLRAWSRHFRARQKPFVVVLNVGGVIETASWKDLADSIVLAWQPGQEAGHAVAAILAGQINPSGKLPTTFPIALADTPSSKNFPGRTLLGPDPKARGLFAVTDRAAEIVYEDDIWVGYRHFSTRRVPVSFPFGFGLSFTRFDYSKPRIASRLFEDPVVLDVKVKNSGRVPGREVVQIYVSPPDEAGNNGTPQRPTLELRTFAKTRLLKPGESETLRFSLSAQDFAFFDETVSSWRVPPGKYTLHVGASSADIRGSVQLQVKAGALPR
ncbi:MAG: glycoside hydrolase family 3 N-terminal domain-containing protein [Gammaproteobacteria bacterium]